MKTINWKKKYEETAGLLNVARDRNATLLQQIDTMGRMNVAPRIIEKPVEKIVEKEVLPLWVFVIVVSLGIFWTFSLCVGVDIVKQLQQPILSPYPVYIAKYVPPDPYALDVCKDAWRADERELRKLRKERL